MTRYRGITNSAPGSPGSLSTESANNHCVNGNRGVTGDYRVVSFDGIYPKYDFNIRIRLRQSLQTRARSRDPQLRPRLVGLGRTDEAPARWRRISRRADELSRWPDPQASNRAAGRRVARRADR